MRVLTQALLLAMAAAADVSCVDEFDSTQLSEAFDAAMMELQGAKGWFTQLKTSTGYHNAQSVNSCTPGPQWKYPAASDATGLLKRVLDSGELRVAGVNWARGDQADYITDPENPTGFWPEYLTEIVQKLSANYGKTITIRRTYYTTDPNGLGASAKVGHAVADGVNDMSEPYYYLGGAHDGMPRIESLAFSCITAGLESFFFTKASSGIASTDALFTALNTGNNKAVGFIGSGNYDSVSHLLPADVTVTLVTNASVMEALVKDGALVAGYNSEGTTGDDAAFNLFATGIVSPRVALFRKPNPTCTATDKMDELQVGLVITLGVLAVVLLLTVSIVVHLIRMEKKGSPLFMPLMKERDVEAVPTPAKGADANSI
jgi:hypothetical protein